MKELIICVVVLGILFVGLFCVLNPIMSTEQRELPTVVKSLAISGVWSPGLTEEEYNQIREEYLKSIR